MPKTWIWICGWAIQPERFKAAAQAALPNYQHTVLPPTPSAIETVRQSGASRIGGYSLGSLLLLAEMDQLPDDTELTCLAPFLGFCEEQQCGGTTPLASLQMLHKRLEQQPEKAIKLFYRLAGLTDEPTDRLPYPVEHLSWGLKQLVDLQVDTASILNTKGYVGLTDPLVSATILQSRWPSCNLIANCGHNYRDLFESLPLIEAS